MKTTTHSLILFLLLLLSVSFTKAQYIEQRNAENDKSIQALNINGKAEELGITPEKLEGILSSIQNQNGGDNPDPEAIQERIFTGQAAGDFFSVSVASAGDVNGDGYDDIIIGAHLNDAGGNNAGRAYIYFGGAGLNSIPDIILTGIDDGDRFGISVSSAGDVNGDGFSDVIVGAWFNSAGGNNAGRAYIYCGGASMDNSPDVILTGAAPSDNFGISVSTAGDVNGDGYSDVIVGAWANDAGGNNAGRAYIYFGGQSMDDTADIILTGAEAEDRFGYSVSMAGDVNGDGYSDVIVGAYSNDAGGNNAGRAYIFFGGQSMDSIVDVLLTGVSTGDFFGYSVSTAGDTNGDGYSDVVVGAYNNDAGGNNAGSAYIFFGGASMDNNPDVILTGSAIDDNFGFSVSNAGDVNGDGYSDIIVGAPGNDNGGFNAGRAYIYFGGANMDGIADIILTGAAVGDQFGYSVSTVGDVNLDGHADVMVGAPFNSAIGSTSGRSYLYTNSLSGTDIPDEFFTGAAGNNFLGFSVSSAGDVNGDGYPDLIVSAYGFNSLTGGAYIYFGGPALDNIADVTLTGAVVGDRFGLSVSSAGDVNGDGYSDVIIGAPENDAGGNNAGRAYIYFGGPGMDNIADIILTGAAAGDQFGFSVSNAGDVNGDGYSDVIVGAHLNDTGGTDAGRAYIYFGGSQMNNVADVIMTGEVANDQYAYSVSAAGDVNGDGYSDVIVGALFNSNVGRAYIYFGGPSMDNTADIILTGQAAGDLFGVSVSSADDINGDGYSDVIVGAQGNDAGGNNAGRAYIYFGGANMDNSADVILTGAANEDFFGRSVSAAGDVNGDGNSDVIVGSWGNDAVGNNAGRAYIYFGGPSMDSIADIILTGAAGGDQFGWSVSTAGDVNGDGFSDVIVGGWGNDAGGSNAGRAYLYLSSSPPIKPRVISVGDVPGDQGGYVFVNFVRSGFDARGQSNNITEYLIEMSNPPGINGFSWWQAGTVQPVQNPLYTFIASTPSDSMTNHSGTFYFRLTARTSNPNEYWRSNIMYGHSVDNLAPFSPESFYALVQGDDVKLGWKANTEPDLRDYKIYRSETTLPEDFTLLTTTTDTTFIDSSPLVGSAYYYIQAYDVHDNRSPFSADSIEAVLSANIRVFLEGAYVGGQMSTFLNTSALIPLNQPYNAIPWNYPGTESVSAIPANVVDWVLVELRSTETAVVETRAAFLKNDGTLVDLDGIGNIKFTSTPEGDYYVVVKHRNHLPVMTADKVGINFSPVLYDMRTDLTKAYGTNTLKNLGGGYFGIFTADTDGSGTVNAADRSNAWNQRNLSGYYGTDVDLSGTVNAADRSVIWNNRNISTQVPSPVNKPITEIVKEANN
jgi:hypothetical protein